MSILSEEIAKILAARLTSSLNYLEYLNVRFTFNDDFFEGRANRCSTDTRC